MSDATGLKIIFAGSGEFGLPTLRALQKSKHEVVQVVSQPDRPAGRGRRLTPTPIGHQAADRGLPLLRTGNINAGQQLPPADLMIVIAFRRKSRRRRSNHPRLGSFNLHASRLPKLRGAAPINGAILNGERVYREFGDSAGTENGRGRDPGAVAKSKSARWKRLGSFTTGWRWTA